MGRLRRKIGGAMAGVMLATGMGGEALAGHSHEARNSHVEESVEEVAGSEALRYAEKFGLSYSDAVELDVALDSFLAIGAVNRDSAYAKIRFLMSIADHPPTLGGLIVSEMLERTPPGTVIDSSKAHYEHMLDGSITTIEGGKTIVLFQGSTEADPKKEREEVEEGWMVHGDEAKVEVVDPVEVKVDYEADGEDADPKLEKDTSVRSVKTELGRAYTSESFEADGEDAEKVESEKEEKIITPERKESDPVTMSDLLNARENPEEVTTMLLDMRSKYDGDSEFNVALQHKMKHLSYLGITELEANFGSYVIDGEGALWVHAPDRAPVKVVGPR
jgi:hypothetical protein